MTYNLETPLDDPLGPELSVRTANCLRRAGVNNLGEAQAKLDELKSMPHFGNRSMNELKEAINFATRTEREYKSMPQRAEEIAVAASTLIEQSRVQSYEDKWRRGVCEAHSAFAFEVMAAFQRLQVTRALITNQGN